MVRDTVPHISFTYEEGKFFDLWMIPHALSGVGLALILLYFGWSKAASYLSTFSILVAWEIVEVALGIAEVFSNRVIDVLLGFTLFVVTYEYFVYTNRIPRLREFVITAIPLIISTVYGWVVYMKRGLIE